MPHRNNPEYIKTPNLNHINHSNHLNHSGGFTLVELIVSMTIAGVLMLGLSTFFASTFHNLFTAQTDSANTQRQFAVNEIVQGKLGSIESVIAPNNFPADHIITFNKNTVNQMPFSYIGTTEVKVKKDDGTEITEKRLAFKDMFVFNKIIQEGSNYTYGDSGNGQLITILGTGNTTTQIKNGSEVIYNFAGFTKIGSDYYVAVPDQDAIYECDSGNCENMEIDGLDMPMDVETNGTDLFISDAGNGRVVKAINNGSGKFELSDELLATGLNFPTGLAYYKKEIGPATTYEYLFVSDTFNNKVRRINLGSPEIIKTIIGDGESDACDKTAQFCKLNMPTGLFVDTDENELYIADSGKNRILKMSDPGVEKMTVYEVPITLSADTQISKIEFEFPTGTDATKISEIGINTLHKGKLDKSGTRLSYSFFVPILDSFANTDCKCVSEGEPPKNVCQKCLDSFSVSDENQIFQQNDQISFDDDATEFLVPENPNTTVNITPNDTTTITFGSNTPAKIINKFLAGNFVFNFNLSTSKIPSGFQKINIRIYDKDGALIDGENQIVSIRVGDGILGTREDTIGIVIPKGSGDIIFPTGVSNALIASSGKKLLIKILAPGADPIDFNPYPTAFKTADFDYIADFPLSDGLEDRPKPLEFKKYNERPEGSILQMTITTMSDSNGNTQIYTHATSLK